MNFWVAAGCTRQIYRAIVRPWANITFSSLFEGVTIASNYF